MPHPLSNCYSLWHIAWWRMAPSVGVQRRLSPVLALWSVLAASPLVASPARAPLSEDIADLPGKPLEQVAHGTQHDMHARAKTPHALTASGSLQPSEESGKGPICITLTVTQR